MSHENMIQHGSSQAIGKIRRPWSNKEQKQYFSLAKAVRKTLGQI